MPAPRIAVYPGDGIGPEVIDQAVRVVEAACEAEGQPVPQWEWLDWGIRLWEKTKQVVPDDFLQILRPFDAILLGAVGWPALIPDHLSLSPLVRIRQAYDQYACVRPARLLPGVRSVLTGKGPADTDEG